jgi:hypothetical protein
MADQSLYGDDLPKDTEKKCIKCAEVKVRKTDFNKQAKAKDGLNPYCKVCDRAQNAMNTAKKPWHTACRNAANRSHKANVPFAITPEYLKSLWTGVCPVFQTVLHLPHQRNLPRGHALHSKEVPSLDRIIPSKGYVPGNVVWISAYANLLKNTANADEILAVGHWLKGVEDNG